MWGPREVGQARHLLQLSLGGEGTQCEATHIHQDCFSCLKHKRLEEAPICSKFGVPRCKGGESPWNLHTSGRRKFKTAQTEASTLASLTYDLFRHFINRLTAMATYMSPLFLSSVIG
jgi:hypothetical protein